MASLPSVPSRKKTWNLIAFPTFPVFLQVPELTVTVSVGLKAEYLQLWEFGRKFLHARHTVQLVPVSERKWWGLSSSDGLAAPIIRRYKHNSHLFQHIPVPNFVAENNPGT